MSELTRFPTWLRAALGIRDPELPTQLETSAGVLPVVELGSAGIRDGDAMRFALTSSISGGGGGAPGGDVCFLSDGTAANAGPTTAALYNDQWLSFGFISADQIAGANIVLQVSQYVTPPNNIADYTRMVTALNLGGGGILTHAQVTGTPRVLCIPPGFLVNINYSAVAAGAAVNFKYQGVRVPAGMVGLMF